jgi:hypothetical protein
MDTCPVYIRLPFGFPGRCDLRKGACESRDEATTHLYPKTILWDGPTRAGGIRAYIMHCDLCYSCHNKLRGFDSMEATDEFDGYFALVEELEIRTLNEHKIRILSAMLAMQEHIPVEVTDQCVYPLLMTFIPKYVST